MDNNFFSRIEKKLARIEGFDLLVTKRHWGTAITLDANTRINSISGEPSAHYHKLRTEEYILYSGKMIVFRGKNYIGDLEKTVAGLEGTVLNPGDKVLINPNVVHIPLNVGKQSAVFIEISHGPYEESDITRIYDKSGRDKELAAKWADLGYKSGIGIKELIKKTNK